MNSFGNLNTSPFSRNIRNRNQTQKCLPSQCDNCIQALRQIIACDNCFSTLGNNLVKMLMSQLSRSVYPCNLPKIRKNSDSEYNPTQSTLDHIPAHQMKNSSNNQIDCNIFGQENPLYHKKIIPKHSKMPHKASLSQALCYNREPNKLKLTKLDKNLVEEKLEIPTVDKYETLKVIPCPFGNSEILDIDRSFASSDYFSEKTPDLLPTKSLNIDPEKIHRAKKNSPFGKRKHKLKIINQTTKKHTKKSSLSKKQAIRKSIGLLKQGLMKKLLAVSDEPADNQKNLLVLENKSKKKIGTSVIARKTVDIRDALELKNNEPQKDSLQERQRDDRMISIDTSKDRDSSSVSED
ncbi:unnamed protein product [Moneuplotes crassus]|uniref:Uncharacterized protein n=1 Tax=Euplotes crassus TaxID=5936 RepID=A0AAD1U9V2_EUPCR|nr:unnamed protein product [Moneuplotes crassus]